jgi:hypothetical protein
MAIIATQVRSRPRPICDCDQCTELALYADELEDEVAALETALDELRDQLAQHNIQAATPR